MSRRKIILLVCGLLVVAAAGLAAIGYIGEHNRDVAAAEDGRQSEEDGDNSAPIAAFVAIFAALIAASQAKKSKQDANKNG